MLLVKLEDILAYLNLPKIKDINAFGNLIIISCTFTVFPVCANYYPQEELVISLEKCKSR